MLTGSGGRNGDAEAMVRAMVDGLFDLDEQCLEQRPESRLLFGRECGYESSLVREMFGRHSVEQVATCLGEGDERGAGVGRIGLAFDKTSSDQFVDTNADGARRQSEGVHDLSL